MNIKELIDLEIERRSLLITYVEMGRGDAYMETNLCALGISLYKRAADMKPVINNVLWHMSEEDKTCFYDAVKQMKKYMLDRNVYIDRNE